MGNDRTMTLNELARQIDAELIGGGSVYISGVNSLEEATAGEVSFLSNPKYLKQLAATGASAVIVGSKVESAGSAALLRTADPYYAFCRAMVLLHGHRTHPHAGIHPGAHVDPAATVGQGSILYPGVYVGPGAEVGRECILYPNVVIYDGCILGDRVIIHAGSVIGEDGFGYATHDGVHHKIPQAGNVIIEDDVEIGANVTIDRATLGSTRIGRGTKFSNLIAIGHGTKIGDHGLLVAQVGIAGSVTVGHHVTMAGQVGVAGHLHIGDQVTIGAQAGVVNHLVDGAVVMGGPAMPVRQGRRVYAAFTQLPELIDRIRRLEKQLEASESRSQTDEKTGQ